MLFQSTLLAPKNKIYTQEADPGVSVSKAQILFVPHGGGPLPLLSDPAHQKLISFLKEIPSKLHQPDLILVISAHWEESNTVVFGTGEIPLLYDYYGFPEKAYQIQYPVPGSEEKALDLVSVLEGAGISSTFNQKRGYDHGVYVPLALMYPEANIPVIQISLMKSLDPRQHLELGAALSPLLEENILILGSGFSLHNMRAFDWQNPQSSDPLNDSFQDWLISVCTASSGKQDRDEQLSNWESAPNSRYCHPREEHLLPLHVCAGLAEDNAEKVFDDSILGKRSVSFLWR